MANVINLQDTASLPLTPAVSAWNWNVSTLSYLTDFPYASLSGLWDATNDVRYPTIKAFTDQWPAPKYIRFPGGLGAHKFDWETGTNPAKIHDMVRLCNSVGCGVLWTLRCHQGQTANTSVRSNLAAIIAAVAADAVNVVKAFRGTLGLHNGQTYNVALTGPLVLELGNEEGSSYGWGPTHYVALWQQVTQAVQATDPTIIVLPQMVGDSANNGGYTPFDYHVMREIVSFTKALTSFYYNINLVDVHYTHVKASVGTGTGYGTYHTASGDTGANDAMRVMATAATRSLAAMYRAPYYPFYRLAVDAIGSTPGNPGFAAWWSESGVGTPNGGAVNTRTLSMPYNALALASSIIGMYRDGIISENFEWATASTALHDFYIIGYDGAPGNVWGSSREKVRRIFAKHAYAQVAPVSTASMDTSTVEVANKASRCTGVKNINYARTSSTTYPLNADAAAPGFTVSAQNGVLSITANSTTNSHYNGAVYDVLVTPGEVIEVSCEVKATGVIGAVVLQALPITRNDGVTVGDPYIGHTYVISCADDFDWTPMVCLYQVPSGVTSIGIQVAFIPVKDFYNPSATPVSNVLPSVGTLEFRNLQVHRTAMNIGALENVDHLVTVDAAKSKLGVILVNHTNVAQDVDLVLNETYWSQSANTADLTMLMQSPGGNPAVETISVATEIAIETSAQISTLPQSSPNKLYRIQVPAYSVLGQTFYAQSRITLGGAL